MIIIGYILLFVALTLGTYYQRRCKKMEKRRWRLEDEIELVKREATLKLTTKDARISELEGQVASVSQAAQDAATMIGEALPSLKEGDWGLKKLVATLINELDDSRKTTSDLINRNRQVRETLACMEGESIEKRAHQVAIHAALAGACAEVLGVDMDETPEKIVQDCRLINSKIRELDNQHAAALAAFKFLGGRKGETIYTADRRCILELECGPGANKELNDIRKVMGIDPGQSVLEELRNPLTFVAKVLTRKDKYMGLKLDVLSNWVKVGEVDVSEEEV